MEEIIGYYTNLLNKNVILIRVNFYKYLKQIYYMSKLFFLISTLLIRMVIIIIIMITINREEAKPLSKISFLIKTNYIKLVEYNHYSNDYILLKK